MFIIFLINVANHQQTDEYTRINNLSFLLCFFQLEFLIKIEIRFILINLFYF